MADVVELETDTVAFAGFEGGRSFVAIAVGEIEDAVGEPGRRPVGENLAEGGGEEPVGGAARNLGFENRRAKTVEIGFYRRAVEDDLAGKFLAAIIVLAVNLVCLWLLVVGFGVVPAA